MNLFQSGGHSSHPRPMPFGYVVVQYINQKSYYWDLLVHLLIWPQEGPKDEYFGPKWQTRLYHLTGNYFSNAYLLSKDIKTGQKYSILKVLLDYVFTYLLPSWHQRKPLSHICTYVYPIECPDGIDYKTRHFIYSIMPITFGIILIYNIQKYYIS